MWGRDGVGRCFSISSGLFVRKWMVVEVVIVCVCLCVFVLAFAMTLRREASDFYTTVMSAGGEFQPFADAQ